MLTRRSLLEMLGGVAAGATAGMHVASASADGEPAWPGPIGLELYTVRDLFAKDPLGTLQKIAAIGYQLVEIIPGIASGLAPAPLLADLRAARLVAPSGYFSQPKTIDEWKRCVDQAHEYGLNYMVIGENPKHDADEWKRLAEFFNRCGSLSQEAAIQFCYHPHYHEFAPLGDTNGVRILLDNCSPNLLQIEMDIFWAIYGGADPIEYWRRYPGRFPLLHIKDLRQGAAIGGDRFLEPGVPEPFVPVGRGRINWPRIFAQVEESGARHIFVEQDVCAIPEFEAVKISYDYLRGLRVG